MDKLICLYLIGWDLDTLKLQTSKPAGFMQRCVDDVADDIADDMQMTCR